MHIFITMVSNRVIFALVHLNASDRLTSGPLCEALRVDVIASCVRLRVACVRAALVSFCKFTKRWVVNKFAQEN